MSDVVVFLDAKARVVSGATGEACFWLRCGDVAVHLGGTGRAAIAEARRVAAALNAAADARERTDAADRCHGAPAIPQEIRRDGASIGLPSHVLETTV